VQKGGHRGPIVVPGKSDESRLFLMISGKLQPMMPMGGKPLAAGDLETIRKWIDAGAHGPAPGEALPQSHVAAIKAKGPVKEPIYSIAVRPTDGLVAIGGFREVRFQAGSKKFSGHADAVRALAFSPDGTLLAAAGGLPARKGEVKIWRENGELFQTIEGHSDCIYAVAFSPDGKQLATSSYDKLIKLWDVATGKEIRTLKDHIDAVYALAFTPDGKRLVSGAADRTVKIWDTATGERLYTLGEPVDGINTVAVDPTGKYVAAAGLDKSIRIWQLGERSGTLLRTAMAAEDSILRLAWSPDGQYLVSSAADRTIKVFRAADLSEVKSLPPQSDWVYGLAFEPDGKKFIAGRFDGSITEYSL
jgi:WD40 repeat protein